MDARPTILVFDSGLGGLTVFREVAMVRPDASYVYVADDAFFPYGGHTEEQLIGRVVPLMDALLAAPPPALPAIACNPPSPLPLVPSLGDRPAVGAVGTEPVHGRCERQTTLTVCADLINTDDHPGNMAAVGALVTEAELWRKCCADADRS